MAGSSGRVASALGAAHRRRILHRDLKLANVMLNDEGIVKVLDFGLAKLWDERPSTAAEQEAHGPAAPMNGSSALSGSSATPPEAGRGMDSTPLPAGGLTSVGQVLGTLPYMSPEQLRGQPVDPRSDLYSFGVLLFELATGRKPFQGATWAALSTAILNAAPPSPSELRPELTPGLCALIERCLAKAPAQRFQSAQELLQALERLAAARPPRRRMRLVAAGVLTVALSAAAGLALWLSRGPATRPPGPEPIAAEGEQMRSSLPAGSDVARWYLEGLNRLRSFDAMEAKTLLEKAAAAEPDNPLIRSALAQAWSDMGYDLKAAEEAKRAFELSDKLSREERLLVEGRYHEAQRHWEQAVAVYAELFEVFPDNLEYGLRLATAQTSAGQISTSYGQAALATLAALRRFPTPASEDPRLDLGEVLAAWAAQDAKRIAELTEEAIAKLKKRGARLLAARVLLMRGYGNLSQSNVEATSSYEEARRIFSELGSRNGLAAALRGLGLSAYFRGDNAEAKRLYEEALAIFREIGQQVGVAKALNGLGNVASTHGDLIAAQSRYEEAIATAREIGDVEDEALATVNLFSARLEAGDLAGARRLLEESERLGQKMKRHDAPAFGNMGRALILNDLGELDAARKEQELGLEVWNQIGQQHNAYTASFDLAKALLAQGDLAGAGARLQESLRLADRLSDAGLAADSRVALAALAIEEGRAADAGPLAGLALEWYRQEHVRHGEALAQAVLARALLAQGKVAEAREAASHAAALLKGLHHFRIRLTAAIDVARVQTATGKPQELGAALAALEAALEEASRAGHLHLVFEARLALGELELRSGKAEAGRRRLAELERDARGKGFGLVARKAAAAQEL